MTRVHARVFSEDCDIEIIDGVDDICRECPRLANGECDSETISNKDAAFLSLLSLKSGDRLLQKEIYGAVTRNISSDDLTRLCSKCRWLSLGYCAEGLAGLTASE
jgi:hypothetical protein